MSASNDLDAQAKEVIRQEQFWFTLTTVTVTLFVGTQLKTPSVWEMRISLWFIIWPLAVLTFYLVVGRHKAYCNINKRIDRKPEICWYGALKHLFKEKSGALYCCSVITLAAIGFTVIIFSRPVAPVPPTQAASPTSAVVPVTIPISTTLIPAQKP